MSAFSFSFLPQITTACSAIPRSMRAVRNFLTGPTPSAPKKNSTVNGFFSSPSPPRSVAGLWVRRCEAGLDGELEDLHPSAP